MFSSSTTGSSGLQALTFLLDNDRTSSVFQLFSRYEKHCREALPSLVENEIKQVVLHDPVDMGEGLKSVLVEIVLKCQENLSASFRRSESGVPGQAVDQIRWMVSITTWIFHCSIPTCGSLSWKVRVWGEAPSCKRVVQIQRSSRALISLQASYVDFSHWLSAAFLTR